MTQQVYVLRDRNSGLLKVGVSMDVQARVGQVNREFGCEAEVIGVLNVVDALRTERFIHGMLEDCRVVGEWFEVPERKQNYLLAYFTDKAERARRIGALAGELPQTNPPTEFTLPEHPMKWDELQAVLREAMASQPRGYQSQLARGLEATPGYVNQMVTGRRAIPVELLPAILESLGADYSIKLSPAKK
ncbi:GIY-YIG nuclease family protein [Deinococcus sp. VB142]|uniref:GIY-YIG nuclease family protein n=1 Tax=Deinococcus sp. VB142 TaxID=3112952 RepID=A0AAU6Q395_9DEIO